MAPETPKKIAIAAAVGGGGLLAFAALRRVRFKKIQAARKKAASEPAEYQSTAPSGSSPGVTLNPSGAIWMIQPATVKKAPNLSLAMGFEKTVKLGKSGLVQASVAKAAPELFPSIGVPGFLGSLVTWGFMVQTAHLEHMRKHLQISPVDRANSPVTSMAHYAPIDGKNGGHPGTSMFPVWAKKKTAAAIPPASKMPLIDYIVGWPAFMSSQEWGGKGYLNEDTTVNSNPSGESVVMPTFGTPSRKFYEALWYGKRFFGQFKPLGGPHVGSAMFVMADTWLGESFNVHLYPKKENSKNLGQIRPGGLHPSPDSYKKITSRRTEGAMPRFGTYDGYVKRAQWLVWCGEWYRLCAPFQRIWFTGKIPKFEPAPSWWARHALSWGIGIPNRWRWENLHHIAWDGIVPPPGMWNRDTHSLLREVMRMTPRPGSMFDRKTLRDTATDFPDRFPAVDWPTETGPMCPYGELPFGHAKGIEKALRDREKRKFEQTLSLIQTIPALVSTVIGNTGGIEKLVALGKAIDQITSIYGISLGPIIPLFSVAKIFTGASAAVDFLSQNPAVSISNALTALEHDMGQVQKDLNEVVTLGEELAKGYFDEQLKRWVQPPWPHMGNLVGTFQDIPSEIKGGYEELYNL